MNLKQIILSAVLLCTALTNALAADIVIVVKPEEVGLSTPRLERISHLINHHIEERKLAGAVVLIARHGKIAYFEPFGQADVDTVMQTDTFFRIASMTKPLISLAVLQLYEEGKLLLSDPVAKYIPEFARTKVLEMQPEGANPLFRLVPTKRDITVRHLLTHTAGLPYAFNAAWFPNNPLYQQIYAFHQEAGN